MLSTNQSPQYQVKNVCGLTQQLLLRERLIYGFDYFFI